MESDSKTATQCALWPHICYPQIIILAIINYSEFKERKSIISSLSFIIIFLISFTKQKIKFYLIPNKLWNF